MAGQEHGPDDTALCDASLLVDIVDAKGGDGSPQENPKELFPGEALEQPPHPRGNGTQTKTSLLNSISAFIIKDIVTIRSRRFL